ncbi:MAG: hypothetical protein DI535_04085 [Citrobacter freundii]|nr:MAG: hypothetical protein DI535_04085 [Citrobacter freundii]
MRIIALPFVFLCSCIAGWYNNSELVAAHSVKTGNQFVYDYTSEGTGYSDIQMLYNTDSAVKAQPFFYRHSLQTTAVNIHCRIRKTIITAEEDSVLVCFEIIQPDVRIESNSLPVDAGMITKEMALPVFASMSMTGNIFSVKTDTAVSYLTAGIIKNILSNTQAVIISGNKSWQVKEEDINGRFKAGYELLDKKAGMVEYRKTNLGYEKIKSARQGQRFLPDNKTTIITDSSGVVQRISTSESLITLFGADTIVASGSSTEYTLISATTVDHPTKLVYARLERSGRYLKATALSAPISGEDINRMVYKNTLADDSFETLTEKMKAVSARDKQYESELVRKFRALAWLSEPGCSKMAALLKKATPASDTFRIISNALAAVETPFSVNELAAVISERRNEEPVMIQLLPILATSPSPTANAADVVQELAFAERGNAFISSTAQLTLGGMVKSLSATDRKKANELIDIITERMKNSRDTLQQLLVYGNTGSYGLLPVYSFYINDPMVSDEIKKAAVFAMRLIDHKEIPSLLKQLSVNKDTVISKAANETILFREQYFRERFQ